MRRYAERNSADSATVSPAWWRFAIYASLCLGLMFACSGNSAAQVNVLTRSYDNARTGANLAETILSPANVNPATFGKLYTYPTDGQLYAQPLYMSDLTIAGGAHNVVFLATMLNTVYALDADTGALLWQNNFGTPITPEEVERDQNITWNGGIGILGTPVIDPATRFMYFVTGNETQVNGAPVYSFNLNAIDVLTGNPVLNSPVAITGSYSTPDLATPLTFAAKKHNQRSALALGNGNVYIAFASHQDAQPYHGWVFAYSASSLTQAAVYSDTTTGIQGGIWNAGGAPTIDSNGYVYISTGNGTFGPTPNGLVQTGNSFIKLTPDLRLADYFTPGNSTTLNAGDQDLGSSGLLLIPNTTYLLGGGKQGVLYLDDTTNMGKFNSSSDQVRQEFQGIFGKGSSHIHGAPVYYNSAVNGPTAYVWGENDYLRAFSFNSTTGLMNTTPIALSSMTAPITNNDGAMPGGFLAVSANGTGNGIVWAATPYKGNAVHVSVPGVVYAFDANTLAPLWSDKANDARDEIGNFAKYTPPVVANGKLYMATFGPANNALGTGALVVYGLLPALRIMPGKLAFPTTAVGESSAYQFVTVTNSNASTINLSAIQLQGTDQSSFGIRQQTCGATLASGASCTFSLVFRPNIAGSLAASVYLYDSAANSPQVVPLTGSGGSTATLLPATLSFLPTAIGSTSAYQLLTLSNTGTSTLNISGIGASGPNASSYGIRQQTCGASLPAGSQCTFSVAFRPNTSGPLPALLRVLDDAAGSPQAVNASGTGVAATTVALSPTVLTFPATPVGQTSAAQPVTLSNTGGAALAISSIASTGTHASSFAVVQNGCGASLAPGASCTFSVTYTPAAGGVLGGTIAVTDNGTGTPQWITLNGTTAESTGPQAVLSPAALVFPETPRDTASAYRMLTLSNPGDAALHIAAITVSGSNASNYGIRLETCGATLAASSQCTFYVTFRPNATGDLPALVRVSDDASSSPQTVSLSATGR